MTTINANLLAYGRNGSPATLLWQAVRAFPRGILTETKGYLRPPSEGEYQVSGSINMLWHSERPVLHHIAYTFVNISFLDVH